MSQSTDYIIINEAELLNEKETEHELNRVEIVYKYTLQEDEAEKEADHIILEEEYSIIQWEIFNKKLLNDVVEKIAQNKLKRRYPNIEFEFSDEEIKVNKRKRKRTQKKVIVLTGTIGVGKTTLAKFMSEYFKKQGLKVYQPEEVSLSIKKELNIFYQDPKRYALFFQDIIIDTYDTVLKNIDSVIDDYDIIILERTHIDTEVFTNINIKDPLKLFYLNAKRETVDLNDIDHVIYVKSSEDITIERQKERNREGETCDEEYMRKIYKEYERIVNNIYSNNIIFNTEECVYLKNEDGYMLDEFGNKIIDKKVLDTYHQKFDKIFE